MRNNNLDRTRGLWVLMMIIYHGIYDLAFIFQVIDYHPWYSYFQLLIGCGFILISGISQNFSKSRWKNFFILLSAALIIQMVTTIFIPEEKILFGVLHLLAFSSLLGKLLEKSFKKIPNLLGVGISFLLFLGFFNIQRGRVFGFSLPSILYDWNWYPLGFPSSHFTSADYYPLIPWFFLYLAGFFLARDREFKLEEKSKDPLAIIGRHSLTIYLLHQPVLYGVFYLIFK